MEQRIKNIFVGGLLALGLFDTAIAGPLEDGLTAYQGGDYTEALRLWRPLANQGNAIAQADQPAFEEQKLLDMKTGCARRRALRGADLTAQQEKVTRDLIGIERPDLWS